jgi:hypothetical protein
MLAVTGAYGMLSNAATRRLLNMIGIASSLPTTAIGITGTPERIAISTKPARPKRWSL